MKSKYTHKEIDCAQYLSELMCERQAAREKMTLPVQFWNLDHWKKSFKTQLLAARALLKLYPFAVIISVLRKKATTFSLRAYWLDDLLLQENQSYLAKQKQAQKQQQIEVHINPMTERKPFKTKMTELDKL